ncbi:MAG: biotin/lipoate A/B protein ligase family protein [bacterium]
MSRVEQWRFIESGPSGAALNMAIDEAIALAVAKKHAPPTLRFYSWDKPSVTIGYFQNHSDINMGFCLARGVPVVRRLTGGRAILHDDEITYSFSAREEDHESFQSLLQSYEILSQAFLDGLKSLGLNVSVRRRKGRGRSLMNSAQCFHSVSLGEIVLEGRKIVGSAQKRFSNSFLQQGSIPLDISQELQEGIFGSPGKFQESLLQIVPGIDASTLEERIRRGFEKVFRRELVAETLTPEERHQAEGVLAAKYASPAWKEFR